MSLNRMIVFESCKLDVNDARMRKKQKIYKSLAMPNVPLQQFIINLMSVKNYCIQASNS